MITQQVPGYPPKPIEDHHIKQQMEKPYVGKHMGQDRPWMFGIPKEVIRQEEVVRHFPEQPMLRLEAWTHEENQLKERYGQKQCHIDNDQPGDCIAGLELVSYVV